jgi:HSP20 family molecular chaperone IbpA
MAKTGFWEKMFATDDTAAPSAQAEVHTTPVAKRSRGIKYDIEDLGTELKVTIPVVCCKSADFDCIGKPLVNDPKTFVADEMRIERKAEDADRRKYLHRGIMPQDTVDIIPLECQVIPESNLQDKGDRDAVPGAIVFTLKKFVPTSRASFTF